MNTRCSVIGSLVCLFAMRVVAFDLPWETTDPASDPPTRHVVDSGSSAAQEAGRAPITRYSSEQDLAYINSIMREYAGRKYRQMERAANNEAFRVHDYYHLLFDGMTTGDSTAVSNAYALIRPRIGQYERRPGDPEPDPDLNNPAWQYVLDAHGTWGEFADWTPGLLRVYANDILKSIPSNAVLFAGTDPGRFVLSAFNAVADINELLIVTQNALADNLYMAYARRLHGDRMSLPTTSDSSKAFQLYVDEVQAGTRPQNAQLEIKDGRVTVSGALGVMEINGILARMIFDRNKDDRQFFVEESFVIPWMYPFLTPHGLIMKLNSKPAPLTDAMVAADHQFWEHYELKLRDYEAYSTDTSAQMTYSKLRAAIGGIYTFRGRLDDAEQAYLQAIRLFPESPEAHYRFVSDVLLRQNRFAEALRVLNRYRNRLPDYVAIQTKRGIVDDLGEQQKRLDLWIAQIRARQAQQRQPSK